MWRDFQRKCKESWMFTKHSWQMFIKALNIRYHLFWAINLIVGVRLLGWLEKSFELNFVLILAFAMIYVTLSPLSLLLWFPQYVKQNKPYYYRGIMQSIGDWIGKPYITK